MKSKAIIISPFEGARLCLINESLFGDELPVLKIKNAEGHAARYKKEKDARLSALGLYALELSLSELGAEPRGLTLSYGEEGRPSLDCGVDISISHSGDAAICLASVSDRVGVDIERIDLSERGKKRASAIPLRLFSPSERESVSSSDTPEAEFVRLWTLREAVGKYTGVGLLRENPLEYAQRQGLSLTTIYLSCDLKVISEQYSGDAAYVLSICRGARV